MAHWWLRSRDLQIIKLINTWKALQPWEPLSGAQIQFLWHSSMEVHIALRSLRCWGFFLLVLAKLAISNMASALSQEFLGNATTGENGFLQHLQKDVLVHVSLPRANRTRAIHSHVSSMETEMLSAVLWFRGCPCTWDHILADSLPPRVILEFRLLSPIWCCARGSGQGPDSASSLWEIWANVAFAEMPCSDLCLPLDTALCIQTFLLVWLLTTLCSRNGESCGALCTRCLGSERCISDSGASR